MQRFDFGGSPYFSRYMASMSAQGNIGLSISVDDTPHRTFAEGSERQASRPPALSMSNADRQEMIEPLGTGYSIDNKEDQVLDEVADGDNAYFQFDAHKR